MLTEDCIQEVLYKSSIHQVINSYIGLRGKIGLCPFHNDIKPSLHVDNAKGLYYCFSCKEGGNVIKFVQNYLHVSFTDAVKLVADLSGVVIKVNKDVQYTKKLTYLNCNDQIKLYCQANLNTNAKSYLYRRGLSPDIIAKFQIGYCDSLLNTDFNVKLMSELGCIMPGKQNQYFDCFYQRIMFPIHDLQGHCVGFGGRAINDSIQPKYVNSKNNLIFNKQKHMYGLFEAINSEQPRDRVVVVEGYMDVLSLANKGLVHVVSCMGTNISYRHIQQLFNYYYEICFCLDGDQAGQKAMLKIITMIAPLINNKRKVKFCILPDQNDPDSYVCKHNIQSMQNLLQQSDDLETFLLKQLSCLSFKDALELAGSIMQPMRHCYQKIALCKLLSDHYQIDYNELQSLLLNSAILSQVQSEATDVHNNYSRLELKAAAIIIQNPIETYEFIQEVKLAPKYVLANSIIDVVIKYKGQLHAGILTEHLVDFKSVIINLAQYQFERSTDLVISELKSICGLLTH